MAVHAIKYTGYFSHNSAATADCELDLNGDNPNFNNKNQLSKDELNQKG